MTHRARKIRPGTAAIAAVLALCSTPLLAQVAPDATQPATEAPATPVPESAPTTTTIEPSADSVTDPLAPEPTVATPKASKSTTTRRTASVARPAKAAAPVARASAPAPAAAPSTPPAETVEAAPVAEAAAPPAPAAAVVASPPAQDASIGSSNMLLIGIAGLALLGLIAVAVAVRRRRRRNEEEFAAVDQYEPAFEAAEPTPAAPVVAEIPPEPLPAEPLNLVDPIDAEPHSSPRRADEAPAFAWSAAPAAAPASATPIPEGVEVAPGSHVEAAYAGPTEDNPSLSLRKRLKRAAFFDQREFLAAAGEVPPMEPDAGLPDSVEVPEPPPSGRDPA